MGCAARADKSGISFWKKNRRWVLVKVVEKMRYINSDATGNDMRNHLPGKNFPVRPGALPEKYLSSEMASLKAWIMKEESFEK